ncbi:MAG: SMR family transporter [Yaniella sp.]|nr:SMR family transporter [Yaniella sp.]
MKRWLLVLGAVFAEVLGTMALGEGMPIGVAYGIWAAAGVALVAIFGAALFGETLSLPAILGIVTIMAGVYLVQAGERAPERAEVVEQ